MYMLDLTNISSTIQISEILLLGCVKIFPSRTRADVGMVQCVSEGHGKPPGGKTVEQGGGPVHAKSGTSLSTQNPCRSLTFTDLNTFAPSLHLATFCRASYYCTTIPAIRLPLYTYRYSLTMCPFLCFAVLYLPFPPSVSLQIACYSIYFAVL